MYDVSDLEQANEAALVRLPDDWKGKRGVVDSCGGSLSESDIHRVIGIGFGFLDESAREVRGDRLDSAHEREPIMSVKEQFDFQAGRPEKKSA